MAITIITTPDAYEPVYTNSMPFEVNSIFQTSENYKYLFSLNIDGVGTPILISTYPRPAGNGVYSPHYALQANCETSVGPTPTIIKANSNSKVKYYLEFGEQYNPGLTFADTNLATAYLGLDFSTSIVSQLFVGDIITIQKDNIGINPWINGTASITSKPTSSSILTDKLKPAGWVSTFLESGSITSITRYSATSSVYIGWNASRQYEEVGVDFSTIYIMDLSTEQSFLSAYETAYTDDLTESKPIYIGDYETLDIFVATASFDVYPVVYCTYVYYDSTNTILGSDYINYGAIDTGELRYIVPTGTQNIVDIGGSGSSFISGGLLDHYEVIVGLGDGSNVLPDDDISRRFNYQVIPDCRPYDVIRLTFLNKLGGYDYWNFNLVSKYKSNLRRTQIDRSLRPVYNIGERGRDVIYSTAVENWTINTDFLTDTDALFIRELVESSSVFIVESNGDILPVVISDSSWEYKSGLLDGYVQYTIEFQKSYDVIINR